MRFLMAMFDWSMKNIDAKKLSMYLADEPDITSRINVKDIDKLNIIIGQCGGIGVSNKGWPGGGKSGGNCGCGGGLSGIFLEDEFKIDNYGWSHGHDYYLTFQKINSDIPDSSILIIAGGGGGGGGYSSSDNYQSTLNGNWFKAIGGDAGFETENYIYGKSGFNTKLRLSNSGGPGTLISGGSGGGRSGGGGWANGQSGSKFKGGDTGRYNHNGYLADNSGTGGSGYYGGGSAGYNGIACAGGGGSSYYAHNLVSPIIAFGNDTDSLNTTNYVPYNIPKSTSLGGTYFNNENDLDQNGGNGYIILEYSYKNPIDRNLYIKYYPTKYITIQTIDEFIPEINSINLRNEESNYKIIDTFNSSIFKNNEYLYFNGFVTETTNSNFINLSITDESIIYANNNIYNCEILYINYSSNLYNYQSDIILQNNIYKVSSNLDNIINQNNETIYNLTSTNNIDNEFDNLIEEFNIEYDTSGIKLLIKYNNPVSSNIEIEKLNRTLYFKEGIEDVEYLVTDGIKYSYGIDNFDSVYYLSLDKFNSELKSNSYKPLIFKYDENNDNGNNQSEWKLNLDKDALYDILIVAGGGAGGAGYYPQPWRSSSNGGGGGAGGVVYMVNKYLLSSVEYKIIVGDGGKGENPPIITNGYNSMILDNNNNILEFDNIPLLAYGGGHGYSIHGPAQDGGSGGGGGGKAIQGNTYWNGNEYVPGGYDSDKRSYYFSYSGGPGGGSAQKGAVNETFKYDGWNHWLFDWGGDGVLNDITGIPTYYAGGGHYPLIYPHSNQFTSDIYRSKGGGGLALTKWNNTWNWYSTIKHIVSGVPHTGSGGGGFHPHYYGTNGGSGIIILKKSNTYRNKLYYPTPELYYKDSIIENLDNSTKYIPENKINYSVLNYLIENNFGITNKSEIIEKSNYIKLEYFSFEISSYPINISDVTDINGYRILIFRFDVNRQINNTVKYILKSNIYFNADLIIGDNNYNFYFNKLVFIEINSNNLNNKVSGIINNENTYLINDGEVKLIYSTNIKSDDLYLPRFLIKYKLKPVINSLISVSDTLLKEYNYTNIIDNMLSTNLIYFIKLINNQWKLSGLDIINKTRYEDVNSTSVNLDIYKGNVIEFDINTNINNPFIIIKSNTNPSRNNTDNNSLNNVTYDGIYIDGKGFINGKVIWNTSDFTVGKYYCISSTDTNIYFVINIIEKINNNDPITDMSVNNLDLKMYYKLEYDNLASNYESRDIIVSNRLGTTILEPVFIKFGYSENTIPGFEFNKLDLYITLDQTNKEVNLLELYKYGYSYFIIETKFPNNNYIIGTTLDIIAENLGVYDIIIGIDNKILVIRVNDN